MDGKSTSFLQREIVHAEWVELTVATAASQIAAQALFELPARALGVALNQPIKRLEQISKTLYAYDAPVVQKSTRAGCVPGKNIETDF